MTAAAATTVIVWRPMSADRGRGFVDGGTNSVRVEGVWRARRVVFRAEIGGRPEAAAGKGEGEGGVGRALYCSRQTSRRVVGGDMPRWVLLIEYDEDAARELRFP